MEKDFRYGFGVREENFPDDFILPEICSISSSAAEAAEACPRSYLRFPAWRQRPLRQPHSVCGTRCRGCEI